MKLYAVQHDIIWENKPANFERVQTLLQQAKPDAGSLIVLPEMFATGFSMNVRQTLEEQDGVTATWLRDLARHFECAVIGGVATRRANGRGRNEAVAFAPDGSELARYAKMQPFTLGREDTVHDAGDAVVTFDYAGFKFAPLICYDLRFPELARAAVSAGAEVLIYIASWPARRVQHWLTLLQARAIENQAWVAGVNRCGSDPEFAYPGRSAAIDPHGVIVADASDRESVLCVDMQRSVLTEWRSAFPALADRRRE